MFIKDFTLDDNLVNEDKYEKAVLETMQDILFDDIKVPNLFLDNEARQSLLHFQTVDAECLNKAKSAINLALTNDSYAKIQ